MEYFKLAATALTGAGLVTKLLLGLGLAGGIVATYSIWHHQVYQSGHDDGRQAAINAIAAEDNATVERATRQRGVYLLCRDGGGRWDQSAGRCSR